MGTCGPVQRGGGTKGTSGAPVQLRTGGPAQDPHLGRCDPPREDKGTVSRVGQRGGAASSGRGAPRAPFGRPVSCSSPGPLGGHVPAAPAASGIASHLFFLLFSPRWERAAPTTLAEVGPALTGRAREGLTSAHTGAAGSGGARGGGKGGGRHRAEGSSGVGVTWSGTVAQGWEAHSRGSGVRSEGRGAL